MASERVRRRIDSLLDEVDAALAVADWATVRQHCETVLTLDPGNADAIAYLEAAERSSQPSADGPQPSAREVAAPALPRAFVSGRYRVLRLLGEGGRKRVYLAHDERLDRDVAFAMIKTEGLDAMGRERVQREARAMARMGGHPNLVSIYDIGEEGGDSYLVQEYMEGGDLALTPRPPLPSGERGSDGMAVERVLAVAKDVASGLAFIHRAGIVHRDLKPGNVFLASDGTAKVGDFGLAMAADLTRITQHGTLVGTVAYMPPEQAVGGEVTAKSDLYSFGALLYELVTGRPPFVGDDPTAIISQHLNTPPVAPSWQREECPPALERIILALLEKDPSKRPADAGEVLSLLEKVDPTERSAPRSEGHVLERLARGVFVGREKELERLRKAFDEAFSGRGGLVMLVGEPGIGKTRTAQELETYARMRGAQVLWGRSHEASGAPAFWPWVQVGRGWGATNDVNTLTAFLASGGSELGRLFPELRSVPGYSEPPVLMDGAAAQFRLFDAYASFVRTISDQKPLVITLDDLHWADKPTLQLLQHLARELARMRVLVVCTYRDTDLVRTHPLSETLADLNREPGFERVVLRGLGTDEVRDYIASTANLQPSAALVERIYEETEGNPFFLSEVVNLLTQEGTLANDSVSDIRIPDGVKEALGRRLDRLSPEANALLQVAAVVGREFTYDTLQLLHDGGDDALLNQLEEGIEARVVEEMPQAGRYRFTHALMQETLLDELSTTRRVRLHGQVGEALERRWGDRAEEYASRLAIHFGEAAGLAEAQTEKAMRYLRLAAVQAEQRFGWVEAASAYERTIVLARDSGRPLSGSEEAELLVGASRGHAGALDYRGAWRSLRRALALFEEAGDDASYARTVTMGMFYPSSTLPPAERRLPLLEAALAKVPDEDEPSRALLLLAKAEAMWALGDVPEVHLLIAQARVLDHGDLALLLAGETARIEAMITDPKEDEGKEKFSRLESATRTFADAGYPARAAETLYSFAAWALQLGQLTLAEDALRRQMEFGRRSGSTTHVNDGRSKLFGIAVLRGQHEQAHALSEESARSNSYVGAIYLGYYDALRGDLDAMGRHLPTPDAAGNVPWMTFNIFSARVQCFALVGDIEQARQESIALEALLPAVEEFFRVGAELESDYIKATLLGAEPDPRGIEIALDPPSGFAAGQILWMTHYPRIRAELLVAGGHLPEAQVLLDEALRWCARERCSAEAGRCHLAFADLEVRRGNVAGALDHLDRAVKSLREYGAPLLVAKAIAKKVELQGLSGSDPYTSIVAVSRAVEAEKPEIAIAAATDGTVTLMFSDIENSTALNELMGDEAWMEVLRAHNSIVEEQVRAHGGRVVKTIGDGYMVVFGSAEAAVRCGLAVQGALTPGPSPPRGRGEWEWRGA